MSKDSSRSHATAVPYAKEAGNLCSMSFSCASLACLFFCCIRFFYFFYCSGAAFVTPRAAEGRTGGQVLARARVRAPDQAPGKEGHHGAGLHRARGRQGGGFRIVCSLQLVFVSLRGGFVSFSCIACCFATRGVAFFLEVVRTWGLQQAAAFLFSQAEDGYHRFFPSYNESSNCLAFFSCVCVHRAVYVCMPSYSRCPRGVF